MKKLYATLAALLLCTAVHAQQFNDPCQTSPKVSVPFTQAASTTLVLGSSARKNYICSVAVVAPDAEKLSVVEGTGTACATSPLALIGGTIAASGISLTANGVFTLGNGSGTVAAGANANFNVCLLQSGTGFVAGVLMIVQQ